MAEPRKEKDGRKVSRPDGQIRQSQLVTTFGPGAMVDLVDRAVVIGGLEHWGCEEQGVERGARAVCGSLQARPLVRLPLVVVRAPGS
jgi:hypothetical protein